MRLLVLGGTSFVGRAIVEDALSRGHELTLFTRGITGTELFPDVERRTGDREAGDYTSLGHGQWDGVVDVSAYVPRHVAQAGDSLADRFGRYLFISTGSVYDHAFAPEEGLTEGAPRLKPERDTEIVTSESYGRLKVACEDDVLARHGERATLVRPGVVAGPHDPTDRFTWWCRAAAAGGAIEAPVRADQPVQVVASRDLARLVTVLVEEDRSGAYNAVGPSEPVTFTSLVQICAATAGTDAHLVPTTPLDPGFPLALRDQSWDPMFRRSAAKAYAAGMPTTPLAATAADVLAWVRSDT